MTKWSGFHMVFVNRTAQFKLAICKISEMFGTTCELNFFFSFFFPLIFYLLCRVKVVY
jgi:hypothetical protein